MNRWIERFVLLLALAVSLASGTAADTRTAALEWTAPGDDGYIGTAKYYMIRFSRSPITPANFLFATPLNTAMLPGPPRAREHMTVVGLTPGVGYYFALRAMDEVGNWSQVSNIAYLPSSVAGVDGAMVGPPQFSSAYPNPTRNDARFSVTLSEPKWLRVEAFDLAGRKVRTLVMGQYSAGHFDLRWDLRDDSGRNLQAGTYLVRSQVGDTVFLRRVTLVH